MYPEWPRSNKDLVPLPNCDGPKLKAFDFQGPQSIEFLELAGSGSHGHVFKVKIRDQIYALKVFQFHQYFSWMSDTATPVRLDDREYMSAFYEYSEHFNRECRAFGRLQEAGHEELAVGCFGYVLLDEEHERELFCRFPELPFEEENRQCFPGRDGRAPPLRAIVKEFGHTPEEDKLQVADFEKMLSDVRRLQQLGILNSDVSARQPVNGKFSDFSTAFTMPHYLTTPSLNPRLTREMKSKVELETFLLARNDYISFDSMVCEINQLYPDKEPIELRAFTGGRGCPQLRDFKLRNAQSHHRVYTFVDPRRFGWNIRARRLNKVRKRLLANPPMWVYDCGENAGWAARLRNMPSSIPLWFEWDYIDGKFFPF